MVLQEELSNNKTTNKGVFAPLFITKGIKMYISIDCDKMTFLRKHNDLPCVCNLAWIESQEIPTYICDISDATIFQSFTLMELQMLYRNTTGSSINGNTEKDALSQILFDITKRLPIADIKPFELELQSGKIPEGVTGYMYCKNSTRASKLKVLFPILKTTTDLKEELDALNGNLPDVISAKIRIKKSKIKRKPSKGNKTSLVRGTAKEVIWETANTMWKESGSPNDRKIVLILRKTIMNTLEEEGIKRASASSELGKWHKETIPE